MPTFNPPVRYQSLVTPGTRGVARLLFRHYRGIPVGITVIRRQNGTYYQKQYPTHEELQAAAAYYLGGSVYQITEQEAADLIAAGYGSGITA